MKKVFIIAVALIAALPVAYANTYSFTSSGSFPISAGTLAAYASASRSGTDPGPITLNGSLSSVFYNVVGSTSYGAGVLYTKPYVTNTSFLVVDFSDPLAAHSTVDVSLDKVDSGYYIYGGNSGFSSGKITGLDVLAHATSLPSSYNGSVTLPITLAKSYTYLVVMAASTCDLNLYSITTNTPTPEPGTLALAGMALIGLGVALRKTRKG
jgi:hypothetical protein